MSANSSFAKKIKSIPRQAWVAIAALLFFAAACFFVYEEQYLFLLIPVVGFVLTTFLFDLNKILILIAFLTPFSIEMALVGESKLSILTEPLLIVFSFVFVLKLLIGGTYDKRLFKHPVTIVILLFLLWMIITSITSEMPLVSFKQTASKLWFIIPFYFGAAYAFQNPKEFKKFFFAYTISLMVIVLMSAYSVFAGGFTKKLLHHSMRPFYNDHTEYGAILALFVPVCWMYLIQKTKDNLRKLLVIIPFAVLTFGLILSYSRAAWISVVAAIGVYFLIKTKIKMKWMLIGAVLVASVFFSYQFEVIYKMGKNRQDSSTDLLGHIKSISNISTDDSNLERLNRWASGFRMIEERPFWGWGPGVYQHKYAPYQKSYQLSMISTNAGDGGNIHSEYFGPLVESGIFGMLLKLMIFVLTFVTGVKVYRKAQDKQIAILALYLTLALLTYYVHGVFNNFLNDDKLSIPFWAFTATIVALDLFYPKKLAADESKKGKEES